ncbi:tetratricopeptide repeat protein [Luteimonas aestuarii]|uniref:Tetratricopeptide repeat protein n=1 Tax=Luteimonas aestuarii TaxID=453837 RepID=A0A4R5TK16_9GAMM|nr:tetratricopeptide repeat protein [Luteimonas aestuarii]TDK19053.1 tetratricopeptide repeat protein [Luteimonas aestuarii]
MKTLFRTTHAKLFVALALVFATTSANAQRSLEERRNARQQQSSQAAAAPAEAQYPNATRQEPEARASARMGQRLNRLSTAYNDGDFDAVPALAEDILSQANANDYDKSVAKRLLGAAQVGEDPAAAIASFNEALAFNGLNNNDHFDTMWMVAQLHAQEGQNEQSLAVLERLAAETNAQVPDHLGLKGIVLYQMERYPEAITAIEAAMQAAETPKPEWTQILMASYVETGDASKATALAEQIAANAPGDKQSQLNLAATYIQADQYDRALPIYERLRAAGELTTESEYRNLAVMYLNSGEKEREAIAVINEGLEKQILKGDHAMYNMLAQAYYFSDQPGPAIDAYRKAAPLAPDGETYLNLAKVLWAEGRMPEAKQAAQQALDKGIRSPDEAQRILRQPG